MQLSPYIQEKIKRESGCDLRLSADAERVALDIESKTGEHIGVNTIKRLLGFLKEENTPRLSTLDIVARYLGYADWGVLSTLDGKSNSSFDRSPDDLLCGALEEGCRIEITYLPDRCVILRHKGEGFFIVEESQRSKLKKDDVVSIQHLVSGYPLYASSVLRDGISLGSFVAGKTQGIKFKIL